MKYRVTEQIELAHGLEVDLNEGWKKITSRQFGGNPGRAASELLQNAIDSYEAAVPINERSIEIKTTQQGLSVIDCGSGLDRKKLQLLVTLGGTDKENNAATIGFFGVGFFSIFNPRLQTERVRVITRCEGSVVELTFQVNHPEEPPAITVAVLDQSINFSTCVEVYFKSSSSVNLCMDAMENALRYYPCRFTVNGLRHHSIWEHARREKAFMFDDGFCQGFIELGHYFDGVTMLCKYERIMSLSLDALVTGGHNMTNRLDDYYPSSMPCLPGLKITLNCNDLHLTISRDSFYLDYTWERLKKSLSAVLLDYLDRYLDHQADEDILLANQFILRNELRAYFKNPTLENAHPAVVKLAQAPIYRLSNQNKPYSLIELKQKLTPGLPLYFSEYRQNLRWLGGEFKHDFIVLPKQCGVGGGARDFYRKLFSTLFEDVVDLDHISVEQGKLKELIDRGIINEASLSPKVDIIGEKMLTDPQRRLLAELTELLQLAPVRDVIAQNLHLPIRTIRPVFIDVAQNGALISTGVFDDEGMPLSDKIISNFVNDDKKTHSIEEADLLLGLSLNHPFIKYLTRSANPHRAYYSLTFVAHELALSQRLLVPYSRFYHLVKERLAAAMRKALIGTLTEGKKAA